MLGHLGNMFDWLTWDISATSVNVANNVFVEKTSNELKTIVLSTIAFVEYGADFHVIWTFHFSRVMLRFPQSIKTAPAYKSIVSTCSFDIELSPISAIELCLRHEPLFPRIWEMCIARGALSYSRCTILKVTYGSRAVDVAEYKRQYELSDWSPTHLPDLQVLKL